MKVELKKVNSLDPEIRKFLLYIVSDTFAEIRKFVEFKQYDRQKIISGLEELCALFDIPIQPKPEEKLLVVTKYENCLRCGIKKSSLKRVHFPYCYPCQKKMRNSYENQKK